MVMDDAGIKSISNLFRKKMPECWPKFPLDNFYSCGKYDDFCCCWAFYYFKCKTLKTPWLLAAKQCLPPRAQHTELTNVR